jgi:hypothetical protein
MKHVFSIFLIFFSISIVQAQIDKDSLNTDTSYLEDQLYLALTYNALINTPKEVSQNGFSGGLATGFIKDIPLNNKGTFGLGIGLGYQYNAYIQNLKISKEGTNNVFTIVEDYKANWLKFHAIDVPLEIRWRNSTLEKYKFWRVYAGVKASYIIASKAKFSDLNETILINNISEMRKMQFGIIFSAGYSTWNLHIYYGLKPLFKNVGLDTKQLDFKDIKIGLKFYIM